MENDNEFFDRVGREAPEGSVELLDADHPDACSRAAKIRRRQQRFAAARRENSAGTLVKDLETLLKGL
jgi:hypothetical protein